MSTSEVECFFGTEIQYECDVSGCDYTDLDQSDFIDHEIGTHRMIDVPIHAALGIKFYAVESDHQVRRILRYEFPGVDIGNDFEITGPCIVGIYEKDVRRGCGCGCIDTPVFVKPLAEILDGWNRESLKHQTLSIMFNAALNELSKKQ